MRPRFFLAVPAFMAAAADFDRADAKRVEHLLFISEYKRFQSALGTRLSKRAFWLNRRYPIVNRWRGKGLADV